MAYPYNACHAEYGACQTENNACHRECHTAHIECYACHTIKRLRHGLPCRGIQIPWRRRLPRGPLFVTSRVFGRRNLKMQQISLSCPVAELTWYGALAFCSLTEIPHDSPMACQNNPETITRCPRTAEGNPRNAQDYPRMHKATPRLSGILPMRRKTCTPVSSVNKSS